MHVRILRSTGHWVAVSGRSLHCQTSRVCQRANSSHVTSSSCSHTIRSSTPLADFFVHMEFFAIRPMRHMLGKSMQVRLVRFIGRQELTELLSVHHTSASRLCIQGDACEWRGCPQESARGFDLSVGRCRRRRLRSLVRSGTYGPMVRSSRPPGRQYGRYSRRSRTTRGRVASSRSTASISAHRTTRGKSGLMYSQLSYMPADTSMYAKYVDPNSI